MTKPRVAETDHGIQGELLVEQYDQMQRTLRDRGWIETRALIESGINHGTALEIGPGPGYLGLEWLNHTQATRLVGVDISPDMLALSRRNAADYGLGERTEYRQGSGSRLPCDDGAFDAVFTNGSLHEWVDPLATFGEIWRALKAGGRFFISDLRRDAHPLVRWFLWSSVKPQAMRPGLITSLNAAYTPAELRELVAQSPLHGGQVRADAFGVALSGEKN